jgi:flavin reductase (DIM6/NTAB) family NADH-FMN oxidoreductase RutF
VIGIGMSSHQPGRPKDNRVNINETGQFTVNLVSEANARAMNITAIEFDYGLNELAEAGLSVAPSTRIKPPYIAESPVAMECELMQIVEFNPINALVLGRILAMHVRDEFVLDPDKHYIDTPKLKLIGRMHGAGWYARTSDLFKMDRIPLADWEKNRK